MIYSKNVFSLGFLIGIILFASVNIYSYTQAAPPCCDFFADFGFPFPSGSYGGFVGSTHIEWEGVLKNLLVAIPISFILGGAFDRILAFRNRMK